MTPYEKQKARKICKARRMVTMRKLGMTLNQIGWYFDLSGERVRQLIKFYERRKARGK